LARASVAPLASKSDSVKISYDQNVESSQLGLDDGLTGSPMGTQIRRRKSERFFKVTHKLRSFL